MSVAAMTTFVLHAELILKSFLEGLTHFFNFSKMFGCKRRFTIPQSNFTQSLIKISRVTFLYFNKIRRIIFEVFCKTFTSLLVVCVYFVQQAQQQI